jgi:hypothetical protein
MKLRTAFSAIGTALLVGLLPLAANADSGISVGPDISTAGLGVSVGYRFPGDNIVLRAESGNLSVNPNFNSNGNAYKGRLNLNNLLLDLEFHPLGRSLYGAVGAFINNNALSASTTSAGVTIGSTNYGAGTANALVTWAKVEPYVGIGIAPMHGGFGFDLGAAYQGNAAVSVTTNIAGVAAADISSAQNQIKNTVNGFQWYPVVGIRYTFGF